MLIALKLLGSIALLIYGMKVMSEALQKLAGPQLRHLLGAMTTNRFSGVLTGSLVTVAVQSSAATTVMTVSFVNAALLTLGQAISIIMGANIGTTMSAWIMSAGFSFNITNVVWPAFLVGIILIQLGKHRYIGDFLFGLSFLLFALGMLKQAGTDLDLASNPAVVDFFASFKTNYGTILLFLLIGTILTAMVQSSAALMAITMVLCSTGAITIYQGIALVMGENIGTTVTANLAALSANTQARRTAMAHLLFNVFGVVWVLIVFFPFVRAVCRIVGIDPTAEDVEQKVGHSCAAGLRVCVQGGEVGRHRGSDVLAHDERDTLEDRDRTGRAEDHGDGHQGRRTLHERGQQGANQQEQQHGQVVRLETGEEADHGRIAGQVELGPGLLEHAEREEQERQAEQEVAEIAAFARLDEDDRDQKHRPDHVRNVERKAGGHDPRAHGGSDVRAHDNGYRLAERQQGRVHERHCHNGGCSRRLYGHGHQRACSHAGEAVGRHLAQQVAQLRSRHFLQGLAHHLHTVDEQGYRAQKLKSDKKIHQKPFARKAACTGPILRYPSSFMCRRSSR